MPHAVLQWLHDTWLGEVSRQYAWIFTTGLVIHFIGLCVLVGVMVVVDLRLLGFGKRAPIGAVLSLLPLAIAGFLMNLATGVVFICFDSFGYWANPAFKVKMVLVLLGGLNALWFTLVERRKLAATGPGADTDILTKLSAAASLLLWFAVILFGRLIVAFQGSTSFFT